MAAQLSFTKGRPQRTQFDQIVGLGRPFRQSVVSQPRPQLPPTKNRAIDLITTQPSNATRTHSSRAAQSNGLTINFTAPPRIACNRMSSSP